MNLARYFDRIGFDGTPRADPDTLAQLVRRHAASIPFENLSPLCGEPVSLALDDIEDKLVLRRRGGYCFEHNSLLAAALRDIGFADVVPLAARVMWGRAPDQVAPRGHMLLKVGERIVDVGFGGLTLTGVLRLVHGVEQATPHEPFRLVEAEGLWRMEAQLRGEWKPLYGFDLQPQLAVDYEAPNYFLSTHPQSHFVHHLMCARALPDRRLALLDRQFTVHRVGGESETRRIDSPQALGELLAREFGIALDAESGWLERFAALP